VAIIAGADGLGKRECQKIISLMRRDGCRACPIRPLVGVCVRRPILDDTVVVGVPISLSSRTASTGC
jgi:hypothetical protein